MLELLPGSLQISAVMPNLARLYAHPIKTIIEEVGDGINNEEVLVKSAIAARSFGWVICEALEAEVLEYRELPNSTKLFCKKALLWSSWPESILVPR